MAFNTFKNAQREVQDFSNNRFMFCLSIKDKDAQFETETGEITNEFIICKRFFKIYNYIEGSMQTYEFKRVIDDIVSSIERELEMETRLYLTYNYYGSTPTSFGRSFADREDKAFELYGENKEVLASYKFGKEKAEELKKNGGFYELDDVYDKSLNEPLADDDKYVLKFSVYDNDKRGSNKLVIEKIFSARNYPSEIRDNIDLTNSNKDIDTERLSGIPYIKAVISKNKEELVYSMLGKIYDVCSPHTKEGESAEDENERVSDILDEQWGGHSTNARNINSYAKERKDAYRNSVKKENTTND